MSNATLGVVLAATAALCIACQALFVRIGTTKGRSNDALFVAVLVSVLVLLPAALVLEYPDYGLTARSIAIFSVAGLLGTLLGRALLYAGIERIGASRAEPIKASMPLFAAIIAVVVLGETMSVWHLAGILLIIAGVALISRESAGNDESDPVPSRHLLLPLGAAFFFGVEPTLAKFGFAEGTSAVVGLAIKTVVAFVGLLSLQWYRGAIPDVADLHGNSLGWFVAAGVASTGFLVSFYTALEVAPVVVVAPIMQTSPLLVILFSALFLRRLERVTWQVGAAASLVVLGAIAITVLG